jgi:antitoxin component of MazEF toxin-antitoxin module
MTITTTQKIIKIGTSRGVTLPAKQLKALGVREGSEVKITVEAVQRSNVLDEYERFKKQYGETLRNLADR